MIARVLIGGCGLAALVLPLPMATPAGVVLTLIGLVAGYIAVQQPGSAAPLVLIAAAALSWLATADNAGVLRLLTFAGSVAVLHSAAAYAAVVPARTPVGASVIRRWVLRTAGTTVGGVVLVGAGTLVPAPASPVLTVVAGLVASLVLGGWALVRLRAPADGG